MPVNGIELKEGQKWLTHDYGVVTIVKPGLNEEYPWRFIAEGISDRLSITNDGKYWSDDRFPILLELVDEKPTTKFDLDEPQRARPLVKPGDKIICNNGLEFVCCTLETLQKAGYATGRLFSIDAIHARATEDTSSWMYWDEDEWLYDKDWGIKEVISQQTKEINMTENQDKQEKTYTLEQIKKIFVTLGWSDAFVRFSKNLTRETDPEYQKYLELKARFEDKE